jgi:predicted exporter
VILGLIVTCAVILLAVGALRGFTLKYTLHVIGDALCDPLKYLRSRDEDGELRPTWKKKR